MILYSWFQTAVTSYRALLQQLCLSLYVHTQYTCTIGRGGPNDPYSWFHTAVTSYNNIVLQRLCLNDPIQLVQTAVTSYYNTSLQRLCLSLYVHTQHIPLDVEAPMTHTAGFKQL